MTFSTFGTCQTQMPMSGRICSLPGCPYGKGTEMPSCRSGAAERKGVLRKHVFSKQ